MVKKVRKAVIPAAGLGTRYLPVTKGIPKEMIPIIDIPMIQFIVEEAVHSGIEQIIFVTAKGKESIENYFDLHYELEDRLAKSGKTELLERLREVRNLCEVISVRQKEPLGLGHAVLVAATTVGDEPFAVLLPDDLVDGTPPCTRQLIDVFERTGKSVVGVMEVPSSEVSKYGIIGGTSVEPRLTEVNRVVEKPAPDQAPTRLAIPGRYVLSSRLFDYLRSIKPGRGGEIQLTDGLEALAKKEGLLAYQFKGDRYDAGDRLGFLDATLTFALKRKDMAEGVKALLKKHLGSGG